MPGPSPLAERHERLAAVPVPPDIDGVTKPMGCIGRDPQGRVRR